MSSFIVKPMDSTYFLDTCFEYGPIVPGVTAGDDLFRRVNAEASRKFGTSAFLAWEDEKVIGFVTFYPRGFFPQDLRPCPWDRESLLTIAREGLSGGSSGQLQVGCLVVCESPLFRRRGVASSLVQEMVEWARREGWSEILVPGISIGKGTGWEESSHPPRLFWERFGFRSPAGTEEISSKVQLGLRLTS